MFLHRCLTQKTRNKAVNHGPEKEVGWTSVSVTPFAFSKAAPLTPAGYGGVKASMKFA
ncbi:MAG: hypothetical protein AB9Q22_06645 [Candidatus Reddybacter sp.]